ncbi:MAG: Ig-like domain-containing protein [Bdellovibrionales bacterium]|nr:Ig-like domain-containing protein [Bdellovibrionales bacterium]
MFSSLRLQKLTLITLGAAVALQGCRASLQWTGFGDSAVSTLPKLSLTSISPTSQAAGTCFDLTIESQDLLGVPTAVTSNTSIGLSYDLTGSYYLGTGCGGGVVSTATLLAGQTTVNVSFLSTLATAHQLTVASSGFQSSTLGLTVTAGPAFSGSIAASPMGVVDVSGATPSTVTVTVYDQWSNLVPGQAITFAAVSGSPGTLTSFNPTTSSVPGANYGKASVDLTPTGGSAGTRTVSISAPAALSSLSVNVVFSAAAVFSQISATPSSTTNIAGSCVTYTVQSLDQFSAPINVPGTETINLSSSTGGIFYTTAGCTGATTTATIASGMGTTTFYFRPTVAGAETVTLNPTTAGTVTSNLTTTPAAVDGGNSTLVKNSAPTNYEADGTATVTMTVTLLDAFGNAISGQSVTPATVQAAVGGDTFTPTSATTNASGQASFSYSATAPGARTFKVSSPAAVDNGLDQFGINFIKLTSLQLSQLPGVWATPLVAGGCYNLRITALDNFSNPYTATGAGISIPLGSAASPAQTLQASSTAFYSNAACTTALSTNAVITSGNSQVDVYFMPTKVGSVSLSMASGSATGSIGPITVTHSGVADLTQSSFSVDNLTDVFANGTLNHGLSLTIRDAYQNAIPGLIPTFQVVAGMGDDPSDAFAGFGATDSAGLSTGTITTLRGVPKTVRVSSPAALNSLQVIANFVPVLDSIQLTKVPSGNWKVGRCDRVDVTLKDIQGVNFNHPFAQSVNVSYSATFAQNGTNSGLFASAGCTGTGQTSLVVPVSANTSTVSFYFAARRVEPLTFTVSGTVGAGLKTQSLGPNATDYGDPNTGSLVYGPAGPVPADNTSTYTLSYSVLDIFNNPIVGIVPALTQTSGPAGFTLTAPSATDGAGNGSATVRTPNGGTYGFRLDTTPALPTPPTTSVVFSAPAYFYAIDMTPPTASPVAGGCVTLTITSRDQYAAAFNVTANESVTLTTSGTGIFYSTPACTTSVGSSTSVTITTGTSSALAYFKPTSTVGETVTATHVSAISDSTVLTPTPDVPYMAASTFVRTTGPADYEADGVTTAGFRITVRDQFSNPIPSTTVGIYVSTGSAVGSINFPMGNQTNASGWVDATFATSTQGARIFRINNPASLDNVSLSAAANFVTLSSFNLQTLVAGAPAPWGTPLSTGQCYGLRIQARDASSNPYVAGAGGISIPLGSAVSPSQPNQVSASAFYSDSICTSAVSSATIGMGSSSTDVYFMPTLVPGPATITTTVGAATGNLSTGAIQTNGMPSLTYSTLTISPSGSPLWANSSDIFTVTLTAKDAFSNVIPSLPGSISITSGADGSDSVSGLTGSTNASGILSGTVMTRKNLTKTLAVTSPAALMTLPSVSADFDPVLDALTLSKTNPADFQVGRCDQITVQLFDNNGDSFLSPNATSLNVSHTGGNHAGTNTGYFTSAGCVGSGTNSLSVPVSASTSSVVFYFAGKMPDTITMTVSGQVGPVPRNNSLPALNVVSAVTDILALSDQPTYDFGTQASGSSVDKVVWLGNSSAVHSATLTAVNIVGGGVNFKGGTYPGIGGSCPSAPGGQVAPLGTCSIVVQFWPTGTNVLSSVSLNVTYDFPLATGRMISLGFAGQSTTSGNLAITHYPSQYYTSYGVPTDPANFDFGSVGFGQTIKHVFTVTNTGAAGVTLSGSPLQFSVIGAPIQFTFAAESSCTPSLFLAPGSNCVAVVAWNPNISGTVNSTQLQVYSTAPTATKNIVGSAVGGVPHVKIFDHRIEQNYNANDEGLNVGSTRDFGTTGIDSFQRFWVANTGDVAATGLLSGFNVTNSLGTGFVISPSPFASYYNGSTTIPNGEYSGEEYCGDTLSAWQTCVIEVTFSPGATGSTQNVGSLNYGGSSRALTATKASGPLLVMENQRHSSISFDFGGIPQGIPVEAKMRVTNVGTGTATGIWSTPPSGVFTYGTMAVYPGGSGNDNFDGQNLPYCSGSLAQGQSCLVRIEISNSAGVGSYSANLRLDYSGGFVSMGLSATIFSGPLLVLDAYDGNDNGEFLNKTYDFGTVTTGTPAYRSFILKNVGNANASAVTVTGFTSGSYFYDSGYPGGSPGSYDATTGRYFCPTSGATITVMQECVIRVRFQNGSNGYYTDQLKLTYVGGYYSNITMSLSGTTFWGPNLVIQPYYGGGGGGGGTPTWNVDAHPTNQTYSFVFKVTNTGNVSTGSMTVDSFSAPYFSFPSGFPGGSGQYPYGPESYCPSLSTGLNAGQTCVVKVDFFTNATGNIQSDLVLNYSGGPSPKAEYRMIVNSTNLGIVRAYDNYNGGWNGGTLDVGSYGTSQAFNLILRNEGASSLSMLGGSATLPPGFSWAEMGGFPGVANTTENFWEGTTSYSINRCSASLAPGERCLVRIRFNPAGTTTFSGDFVLPLSGAAVPEFRKQLRGQSISGYQLSIREDYNFAPNCPNCKIGMGDYYGNLITRDLVLVNTGQMSLSVNLGMMPGFSFYSTYYRLDPLNGSGSTTIHGTSIGRCGPGPSINLSPNQGCAITVRFLPTAATLNTQLDTYINFYVSETASWHSTPLAGRHGNSPTFSSLGMKACMNCTLGMTLDWGAWGIGIDRDLIVVNNGNGATDIYNVSLPYLMNWPGTYPSFPGAMPGTSTQIAEGPTSFNVNYCSGNGILNAGEQCAIRVRFTPDGSNNPIGNWIYLDSNFQGYYSNWMVYETTSVAKVRAFYNGDIFNHRPYYESWMMSAAIPVVYMNTGGMAEFNMTYGGSNFSSSLMDGFGAGTSGNNFLPPLGYVSACGTGQNLSAGQACSINVFYGGVSSMGSYQIRSFANGNAVDLPITFY